MCCCKLCIVSLVTPTQHSMYCHSTPQWIISCVCMMTVPLTHIQGFVPANNIEFRSETIVPAAFAAIAEVNANCSILPEYKLVLEFVNTMVSGI